MRILFVGWPVTIHAIRWIGNLPKTGLELHFYAWDSDRSLGPRTHERVRQGLKLPKLENVTLHYPSVACDARELAELITRVKPDLVHSMPIQGASSHALEAKLLLGQRFPPWFVSAWGLTTEVLFGPWFAERSERKEGDLSRVLSACDFLFAESSLDVTRARALGFKGTPLLVGTVAGGFDLEHYAKFPRTRPSRRDWVLLKGYQHFYGRALTVLKAFEYCAEELSRFKIGICAAAPSVELAAQLLRQETGLSISVLPFASYDNWLRRLGKARVFIGNNLADGRPNAMSEAMLMGALPVQSDTAYTKGWISNRRTGFLVPHDDPRRIATALRLALTDDLLVDRAATLNFQVIQKRLSLPLVQKRIVRAYRAAVER